jgi:hypothetical protein
MLIKMDDHKSDSLPSTATHEFLESLTLMYTYGLWDKGFYLYLNMHLAFDHILRVCLARHKFELLANSL